MSSRENKGKIRQKRCVIPARTPWRHRAGNNDGRVCKMRRCQKEFNESCRYRSSSISKLADAAFSWYDDIYKITNGRTFGTTRSKSERIFFLLLALYWVLSKTANSVVKFCESKVASEDIGPVGPTYMTRKRTFGYSWEPIRDKQTNRQTDGQDRCPLLWLIKTVAWWFSFIF